MNFDFSPAKIARNQPIVARILTFFPRKSREIGQFFRKFTPENPAKFCFFFRKISEALKCSIVSWMLLAKRKTKQTKWRWCFIFKMKESFNHNNRIYACTNYLRCALFNWPVSSLSFTNVIPVDINYALWPKLWIFYFYLFITVWSWKYEELSFENYKVRLYISTIPFTFTWFTGIPK